MSIQTSLARLHDRMHEIPGVPLHRDAEELHRRHHRPHPRQRAYRHALGHRPCEPRVRIGWQNAIAGFFARLGDQ